MRTKAKKTKTTKKPSAKQLAARAKFAAAAKARAKNPTVKKSRAKQVGQVWIEKRGTTQGRNNYYVYVRTATGQDVDMYDSPNEADAKWSAKTLRQKIKQSAHDVAWIKKTNPKRGKNADHRDADHPISVVHHWRQGPPGYLTPWQRAHHAGQADLFAHGIKPAKIRHKNPTDLENQAIADRIEFAGQFGNFENVYAPIGTPAGLSRLGILAALHLNGKNKLLFRVENKIFLAQDTKHKLHIVASIPGALVDNDPGDYGPISKIEYIEEKPHLGEKGMIQWVHKMGEVTGERPNLIVNKDGQLLIKGGNYSINWRGIIN